MQKHQRQRYSKESDPDVNFYFNFDDKNDKKDDQKDEDSKINDSHTRATTTTTKLGRESFQTNRRERPQTFENFDKLTLYVTFVCNFHLLYVFKLGEVMSCFATEIATL